MQCGLTDRYQHFRGTYCLHFQGWSGSSLIDCYDGIQIVLSRVVQSCQSHTETSLLQHLFLCHFHHSYTSKPMSVNVVINTLIHIFNLSLRFCCSQSQIIEVCAVMWVSPSSSIGNPSASKSRFLWGQIGAWWKLYQLCFILSNSWYHIVICFTDANSINYISFPQTVGMIMLFTLL
jgi:hypothetical protein